MTNKNLNNEKLSIISENILPSSAGRDSKGRFAKGNKIATDVHITGVRSIDIRKHRALINVHIPQLLEILLNEALVNRNLQVMQWLVDKVVPDMKATTFINSAIINEMNTLEELKGQSSQTIKESMQGNLSLEGASALISMYKEHKDMIEAADIEPFVEEMKNRLNKNRKK